MHILLAVTFLCLILTLAALVATRRDLRHSRDALAHLRAYHEERNARPNALSHELRTPLTVVQGSAELLLEESPGPLNALQREFVSTIAENSHQVIEMANDLLEEARIESELFRRSSSNPRRPGSCQRGRTPPPETSPRRLRVIHRGLGDSPNACCPRDRRAPLGERAAVPLRACVRPGTEEVRSGRSTGVRTSPHPT